MAKVHLHHSEKAPSPLSATIARNLRRLRHQRGYSLDRLAQLAELPLPDLDQVETGKAEPTLEFAWKLANALDIPFAALIAEQAPRGSVVIRKAKAKLIVSEDLGLTSRSLLPFEADRRIEFYELRLAPQHHEVSGPHAPGTTEVLVVADGDLEVTVGREPPHIVNKGDAMSFPADLRHSYRNLAPTPATLHLVINYERREGHVLTESRGKSGDFA